VRNPAGLAWSIVLTFTLLVLVAILWNQRSKSVTGTTPQPDDAPAANTRSSEYEQLDTPELTPDDTTSLSPRTPSNGNVPAGVLTVNTWFELQEYADRNFNRWDFEQSQPDDLDLGYFDGVVGGGYDPAVRFRINSVFLSTHYLDGDDNCRIRIDARPLNGEEAGSFGTLSIDLTIHGVECESPADLVGQRLDFREGDYYAVELKSYYQLGDDGTAAWGTRWENSTEIYRFFLLHFMALDDGYLIGTIDGALVLSDYQGERVAYQRPHGRLIGTFRSRFQTRNR
jgi:hypothetical protein